jgi:hypothetical protein
VQKIIDSDQYTLPSNVRQQYKDLFIDKTSSGRNPAVIFALVNDPDVGPRTGLPCLAVSSAAGPELAGNAWNQYHASLPFYRSFSDKDLRKKVTFLTEFKNGAGKVVKFGVPNIADDGIPEDGPPIRKYTKASPQGTCNDDNNWIVFRYADVLLMKAEALNEVNHGPIGEAYSAINKVRKRAGLDPLSGLSYEEFRKAVYTARRKELVGEEQGWFTLQRFWDIATSRVRKNAEFDAKYPPERRFGPDLDKLDIQDPRDRLLPIPAAAIDRNPKLKQNPGYD